MSTNDQDKKNADTTPAPEQSEARRRLLKTLAAGGVAGAALPAQWTKPVIEAVILPAHAQATSGTVVGGGGGGGAPGPAPTGSVGESILNFFVSPAQAGSCVSMGYCIQISVAHTSGTPTAVAVTKVQHPCNKSGLITVFTGSQALSGSGSNWNGNVVGLPLALTNVNPLGGVLANCSYDGVVGVINNGVNCGADNCNSFAVCSAT